MAPLTLEERDSVPSRAWTPLRWSLITRYRPRRDATLWRTPDADMTRDDVILLMVIVAIVVAAAYGFYDTFLALRSPGILVNAGPTPPLGRGLVALRRANAITAHPCLNARLGNVRPQLDRNLTCLICRPNPRDARLIFLCDDRPAKGRGRIS